jgi:hypothetical protein
MANIFNINDKNILATASITITDQTDAANLGGGLSVIAGSRNQVYLTESGTFSPDWTKNFLVIRPYLYASSITRTGNSGEYNPDLFSPDEYPSLAAPEVGSPAHINTESLSWYIRDASGTEILINPLENNSFTYNYTHNGVIYADKRFLVITNNIIPKDSFATIICKFTFRDPYAKIFVNQIYEMDLSCLTTGRSNNQLTITTPNGTSIYNNSPSYVDLYASYFKDGVEIDVQKEIESQDKYSNIQWFIRSASGNGWTLLDATKQDENDNSLLYEVRRYTEINDIGVYTTEKTTSSRGGFCLRVHPGLITGSNIIKAVFSDTDLNASYNALEVVYDTTDDLQAYIHSSNGDKIYQGANSIGTTLTCMLKYQGVLMETDDPRYETNFEYYWFRVSADGKITENIYLNNVGELISVQLPEGSELPELYPTSRTLPIKADDVDKINTFQCAVVDKQAALLQNARTNLILNSPSEEDLITASLLNSQLGLEDNPDDILNTAYEINTTNIINGTSLTD